MTDCLLPCSALPSQVALRFATASLLLSPGLAQSFNPTSFVTVIGVWAFFFSCLFG